MNLLILSIFICSNTHNSGALQVKFEAGTQENQEHKVYNHL